MAARRNYWLPEHWPSTERAPSRAHRTYFTFAITCISRYMILRDRVFGLSEKGRRPVGDSRARFAHTPSPAGPAGSMRCLSSLSLSPRMRRSCSATASAKPSSSGSASSSCSPQMASRRWCSITRDTARAPGVPTGISSSRIRSQRLRHCANSLRICLPLCWASRLAAVWRQRRSTNSPLTA